MILNKNEKLNENGIANDSLVNITLYEARDLKPEEFLGSFSPLVVLELDDQKDQSAYKQDNFDPVWNENFSL